MAPPVAIMVGACRKSSTPLTLLCAGNLLEGAKRGIGNLVFVTLPPDLLRVLRAGVPGESYVKGCLLLPWHAPGPPAVLPLGPTALTPTPSLRSLPLPRCAHSHDIPTLRSGCPPPCGRAPIAHAKSSISSLLTTSFTLRPTRTLALQAAPPEGPPLLTQPQSYLLFKRSTSL